MNFLERRIIQDGKVRPGNILKVDSFLNHQIDVSLLDQIGAAFYDIYKDKGITKVLTVEASGIAIACSTARYFHVPVVFAKKSRSNNIDGDTYVSIVHSYTYDQDYPVTVSRKYLQKQDKILLVDDFLAEGKAALGLIDICHQAGADVGGIGIAIEKGFQSGGKRLREAGYTVTSIAIIEYMDNSGHIVFRNDHRSGLPGN